MKRFLSLLLIVSLLLSLSLPAVAADAEFTDVEEGSFYEEAVLWAVENGVTYGTTETTFSPDNRATRAEVVTFLWRVAGKPEPLALENAFTDVVADDWYAASVQWAVEQGITSGTSETTFSPNKVCSRADAVTFLWRAKGRPEPDAEEGPFTDVEADSYYEKAVLWAAGTGVTAGTGETTFSPRQKCNRAQIVTFLHRYAMLQPEDPDFTEREVPVLHDSLDSTETATLRVYEDLPDVPYMSVTDFYNQFYLMGTERTEGMDFTHTGSSYVVTNFGGYAARFDVSAETITVDSLEHFTCPAYYLEIRQAGAVDENYPFVRQTDTLDPLDPAPLTLRLADYGIDLRGDATGVYLPLATLCDLFATAEL